MSLEVVSAWGSGTVHVADVPENLRYPIEVLGSHGEAVEAPVVTICRAVLRVEPVVVMTKARVGCRPCKRLSGVAAVGIGSQQGGEE